MALSRIKIWSSGEVLTASDLNGEINNILTHPGTLVSPMPVAMLHADGTLAAPGISWSGEPNTGFARTSATVMNAVIAGANNMQWQPGHTFCFTAFDLPNAQAINFYNAAGNALWEVIHANAANTVHIGRIGWGATTIYGGGVGNLTVTAAGVALSGTITGISGATIGLPEVANARQIYNLRGSASNAIYVGYTGGWLDTQVDATYFGTNWPINITGTAARVWNAATVGSTQFIFHWSDPGTSPDYVWGSVDGTNMKVYPPGRLNVNYANSAGSTPSANYANDSGQTHSVWTPEGVVQHFNWSVQGSPSYLWGNWGDGNCYLYPTGGLSVSYANNAGHATNADNASYATNAGYAASSGTASAVSSINGAGGGTIQGVVIANGDSHGGGTGNYASANLMLQSRPAAYPSLSFHRVGATAWTCLAYYDNSYWIGHNSNGGPSALGGYATLLTGTGHWKAAAFEVVTLRATNVLPLAGALADVLKLRGVRCFNEDTQRPDITVMADEIELAFPELVSKLEAEDGALRGKAINYSSLAAPIIEAIRELNDRLTALENA